jgi:PAS domain S-box-containing protein
MPVKLDTPSIVGIGGRLEESLRAYTDLFDFAPVGYCVLSPTESILRANLATASLLGSSPAELTGQRFGLFVDEGSRSDFSAFLEQTFSSDECRTCRVRVRRLDDSVERGHPQLWLKGRGSIHHGERCVLVALVDVTEQRQMEEARIDVARHAGEPRQAQGALETERSDLERQVAARTAEMKARYRLAEQASRAKSEFLAHMSHEIRTPLSVMLGLAQLLGQSPLDVQQQHQVRRIREAGENLLAILNDILDLSKIEAGKLIVEHQPFALDELLARLASFQGCSARAKGLSLHIHSPMPPLPVLLGDRLRLEQVLNNLVGNAIKFTDSGRVDLRVQARDTEDDTLCLRFEVKDTGIGIEPQKLAELFEPFIQADASITRCYGGTGLGLAISRHLVELMDGEIGAVSRPGQGSLFWFELPFRCVEHWEYSHAEQTLASTVTIEKLLTGRHVLVVDDNAMNQEVVEQVLSLAGATVSLANDGAQALQRLRLDPNVYQAVLMDIQMPVMDGLTATRLIRQELGLHRLPIIGLTAGVQPQERQKALDAGMNELLNKPIRLERLANAIRRWLPDPSTESTPTASPSIAPGGEPAAAFPMIPGIDREQAAEILCGNRTMFRRLLELLVTEAGDLVEHVRQDLERGRRREAAARLHNLKSQAGSVGASAIQNLAKHLEEAIDRGENDLGTALEDLDRQLRDLIEACAVWQPP